MKNQRHILKIEHHLLQLVKVKNKNIELAEIALTFL
jgi:hypothetical protein